MTPTATPTATTTPVVEIYLPLLLRNWTAVSNILVSPANPTTSDTVQIRLDGRWGNSCPTVVHSSAIVEREDRHMIHVLVGVTSARPACLTVVTGWTVWEHFEPLPAGTYIVDARVIDLTRPNPIQSLWSFTGRVQFIVTE